MMLATTMIAMMKIIKNAKSFFEFKRLMKLDSFRILIDFCVLIQTFITSKYLTDGPLASLPISNTFDGHVLEIMVILNYILMGIFLGLAIRDVLGRLSWGRNLLDQADEHDHEPNYSHQGIGPEATKS